MQPYLTQQLERLTPAQLVDVIAGIEAHLHRLSLGTRGRAAVPAEEREAWLALAPADLLPKVAEGRHQVELHWREVMGRDRDAESLANSALHEEIKTAQRRSAAVTQAAALAEREERLRQFAQGLLADARATSTWLAYRRDWEAFTTWCTRQGRTAMPARAETVMAYLTELAVADRPPAVATIRRRLAGIAVAHQVAGVPSPTADPQVKELLKGIRRRLGTAQRKKAAAATEEIRRMVATCDRERLLGLRDRALLLVGFAGAFRRSELVSLDVADLEFVRDGVVITLGRSKTDQESAGTQKGIPYGTHPETCPVEALQSWLTAAGITEGPIFRGVDRHDHLLPGRLSDRGVARAVQRAAQAAGLDPARYAGHSLRAGLATAAAGGGAPDSLIADQTGHRSMQILRGYIRRGSLFRTNAVRYTGL